LTQGNGFVAMEIRAFTLIVILVHRFTSSVQKISWGGKHHCDHLHF